MSSLSEASRFSPEFGAASAPVVSRVSRCGWVDAPEGVGRGGGGGGGGKGCGGIAGLTPGSCFTKGDGIARVLPAMVNAAAALLDFITMTIFSPCFLPNLSSNCRTQGLQTLPLIGITCMIGWN